MEIKSRDIAIIYGDGIFSMNIVFQIAFKYPKQKKFEVQNLKFEIFYVFKMVFLSALILVYNWRLFFNWETVLKIRRKLKCFLKIPPQSMSKKWTKMIVNIFLNKFIYSSGQHVLNFIEFNVVTRLRKFTLKLEKCRKRCSW